LIKKIEILLGTAQWGLDYGVANTVGKIKQNEINKIIEYCLQNRINFFDSARDYGNSEEIIGKLNKKYSGQIRTVSKIKNFNLKNIDFDKKKIRELILLTHKNTFQNCIEGMLIHDDFLVNHKYFNNLWQVLIELKNDGKIKKIGFSTYRNNFDKKILEKYKPDIVQLPYNVYDQSRSNNGFFKKLKDKNIEIHVRSVFLQGLLILNYKKLNSAFSNIIEHQKKMHHFFKNNGMSVIEGCLKIVVQNKYIDKIILGCDNVLQLKEIHQAFLKVTNLSKNINFKKFMISDKKIINPTLWKIDER
jgi:aryl-alcohol dehydrogenase-like predicted oxidoreductase